MMSQDREKDSRDGGRAAQAGAVPKRLRVCIIAASLDILGGQAIEAQRILRGMRDEPSVEMSFLPINPRLPDSAFCFSESDNRIL